MKFNEPLWPFHKTEQWSIHQSDQNVDETFDSNSLSKSYIC